MAKGKRQFLVTLTDAASYDTVSSSSASSTLENVTAQIMAQHLRKLFNPDVVTAVEVTYIQAS